MLKCYINVVGGIKLDHPAADLAVALSLISSLRDKPLDDNLIAFGEIGLAGEIRSVVGVEKIVVEAKKLGFNKIIVPSNCMKNISKIPESVKIIAVDNIKSVISMVFNA